MLMVGFVLQPLGSRRVNNNDLYGLRVSNIVDYHIAYYFGIKVVAYVTKSNMHSCYPWMYALETTPKKWRMFCGIPNVLETKKSALKKAWYRAKWISDGTWSQHYR